MLGDLEVDRRYNVAANRRCWREFSFLFARIARASFVEACPGACSAWNRGISPGILMPRPRALGAAEKV